MTRRRGRVVLWVALALGLVPLAVLAYGWLTYPSDRTPEGAYLRVMSAVNRDAPEAFFAYLETEAQHACYTVRNYRGKARERVLAAYPEPERSTLAAQLRDEAEAHDGADVFALHARQRGWLDRLRRDLSGVTAVEIVGERATVVTAKGTRYPFRRRDNGIWGLTLFTSALVSEAERAARDAALIERSAADYERARRLEGDAAAPR